MKLTILLMTTFLIQISAETLAQKITINKQNIALEEVLTIFRNQSGYDFLYTTQTITGIKPISIQLKEATLQQALTACFNNLPLTYVIQQNTIVIQRKIAPLKNTFVAPIDVNGKVVDENGLPLPGATIQVKGTKTIVVTNGDGVFELKKVAEKAILVVSFMGYKSKEIRVETTGVLTIQLEIDPALLSEVVIVSTGYQNIPKERAAGSIDVINADKDLQGKLQLNILDRIEGMSAGLTSYKVAGNTQVRVRGVSTIKGNSEPLYVVDGAPFEGDIQSINPSDVENISILKDATAASIYGARSANGVIVINTRKGKKGPLKVNYNSAIIFTPLSNRSYANRMSSAELVDFQRELFNYASGSYAGLNPRQSMNEVYRLLYEEEEGNITAAQLETELDVYRNSDRYDEVLKEFIRKTAINQQHNLSFSGGSELYRYNLSANYLGSNPHEREQSTNRMGFNLRNTFNFTKWLKFDLGVLSSNVKEDYDNGISGVGLLNGGNASYFLLRDESGNPVNWLNSKSQLEIDRLNDLSLLDESYQPLNALNKKQYTFNNNYLNVNVGANFKITNAFSVNLLFQEEKTTTYQKQVYNKDAYEVKTQINDATIINKSDGKIERLIPLGGQVNELRGNRNSHTFRVQLNYSKLLGQKHQVDIIAGTEQRKIVNSSTNVYKYGYDDFNLNYVPINDQAFVIPTMGTEAISGLFLLNRSRNNPQYNNAFQTNRFEKGFVHQDDRYVSFYANGSYTFDRKITATASIRMDQSNLFGTDPKYQYKPLWSAGLLYVISENQNDWLDRLAVRTTYGINGNISKEGGPYLISVDERSPNPYTNESRSAIASPPNAGLRWEKTKVTNLAVDFSLWKSRLTGSVEFYNKHTTDLLGRLNSDPTIGWYNIIVNYGSMRNRGVDVSLSSTNVNANNFKWRTTVNFNYNKNLLVELENDENTVYSYFVKDQNRINVPMNAIYGINYKGLDMAGRPIALTKDGKEVKNTDQLAVSDLTYHGTATPPYAASLANTLNYKNFNLFFMFIYYGGHVMRDVIAPYLTRPPEITYTTNIERNALNYWKKPGDEQIDGIAPGFNNGVGPEITQLWEAANQHVQNASYLKLRDITLGYTLANNTLKKNHIQKIRFSFQLQNVWRWSANKQNLDPEVWRGGELNAVRGNLLPPTYTFGLAINL